MWTLAMGPGFIPDGWTGFWGQILFEENTLFSLDIGGEGAWSCLEMKC